MAIETKLWVNREPVNINPFIKEFLAAVTMGAVCSLKGANVIKTLDLFLDRGEVQVLINDVPLSISPFPNDLLTNTLQGLVSTLKGVDTVQTMRIYVQA